jgi:YD repeat-containing protein
LEPTGVLTSNTYYAVDNLGGVSAQCLSGYTCSPTGTIGQPRSFIYTSFSRLQSATNPESGTTSYTYDDNGNLHTRMDTNGSVATYAYDALNRPLTVPYGLGNGVNATPAVTYTYDNNSVGTNFTGFVGAPSSVSSAASRVEYSYDGLGRIVASQQTTPERIASA